MLLCEGNATGRHSGYFLQLQLAIQLTAPHSLNVAAVFILQFLCFFNTVGFEDMIFQILLCSCKHTVMDDLQLLCNSLFQIFQFDNDLLTIGTANQNTFAILQITGTTFNTNRNALHLVLSTLPTHGVVAVIHLYTEAGIGKTSLQFTGSFQNTGLMLRNRQNDHLHGSNLGRQNQTVVKLDELEAAVAQQLELVHNGMFERAKKNLEDHIYEAHSVEEAKQLQEANGGFVKTMWCGELDCELKMKEVAGMSSRCIPFAQEKLGDTCACCGKPADKMIYWGVAY